MEEFRPPADAVELVSNVFIPPSDAIEVSQQDDEKKKKAVTENTANVAAEDQSSTDLLSGNGSSDSQKNKKPIVSREDFKLEEDEFIKKVSENPLLSHLKIQTTFQPGYDQIYVKGSTGEEEFDLDSKWNNSLSSMGPGSTPDPTAGDKEYKRFLDFIEKEIATSSPEAKTLGRKGLAEFQNEDGSYELEHIDYFQKKKIKFNEQEAVKVVEGIENEVEETLANANKMLGLAEDEAGLLPTLNDDQKSKLRRQSYNNYRAQEKVIKDENANIANKAGANITEESFNKIFNAVYDDAYAKANQRSITDYNNYTSKFERSEDFKNNFNDEMLSIGDNRELSELNKKITSSQEAIDNYTDRLENENTTPNERASIQSQLNKAIKNKEDNIKKFEEKSKIFSFSIEGEQNISRLTDASGNWINQTVVDEESRKSLNKLVKSTEQSALIEANVSNPSNPKLSPAENLRNMSDDAVYNLQKAIEVGNERKVFIPFDVSEAGSSSVLEFLPGQKAIWSKMIKIPGVNIKNLTNKSGAELTYSQLAQAGINSEEFEGIIDQFGISLDKDRDLFGDAGLISQKEIDQYKAWEKKYREEKAVATGLWNATNLNQDYGSITKPGDKWYDIPGHLNNLASSTTGTFSERWFDASPSEAKKARGFGSEKGNEADITKELNILKDQYNNSQAVKDGELKSIEFTKDQEKALSSTMYQDVANGVGEFVPMIIELAAVSLATEGAATIPMIASRLSRMAPLTKHLLYGGIEEVKMQALFDMPPTGGAAFYTLGHATRNMFKFSGPLRFLQGAFDKTIKSGVIGAASSEFAHLTEKGFEQLAGDGTSFSNEFNKFYSDQDEVTKRIITNAAVFGLTGVHNLKKLDYSTQRMKFNTLNEISNKIEAIEKDISDRKSNIDKLEKKGGVIIPKELEVKLTPEDIKKYATKEELQKLDQYTSDFYNVNKMFQAEALAKGLDHKKVPLQEFEKNFNNAYTKPINEMLNKLTGGNYNPPEVKFTTDREFFTGNETAKYVSGAGKSKGGVIYFDINKYVPGKAIHEFTHLALDIFHKQNPTAKENMLKKFSEMFKGVDLGEVTGNKNIEGFKGEELMEEVGEAYKPEIIEASTRAGNAKAGEMLKQEEFVTFIAEMLTKPEFYYQNTKKASNILKDMKDYVTNVLQGNGMMEVKAPETAQEMVNLIVNMGENVRQGRQFTNQFEKAFLKDINIEGLYFEQKLSGNPEGKSSFVETKANAKASKDLVESIVEENTRLVGDLKEAIESENLTKQIDIKNDLALNNEPLIQDFVNQKFKPGLGVTRDEFKSGVYSHVFDKVNKTYNPIKNPEYGAYLRQVLFGGGGFGGGRLGDILREIGQKEDLFLKSTEDPNVQRELKNIEQDAPAPVETSKKGDIVVAKELNKRLNNVAEPLVSAIKEKIPTDLKLQEEFLKDKTYKTLKDLAAKETQEMFGIKPKPGNLTKSDVKNAQMFINRNPDLFYSLLPKQHTTKRVNIGTKNEPKFVTRPDKATGVQNVLLDAFYNKGTRKDNLTPWTKKPSSDVKTAEFLELFGITDRNNPNLYKKDSNVSARIKALVEQTGRIITNQTVREVTGATKVGEGRAETMASKELVESLLGAYDLVSKNRILTKADKARLLKTLTKENEKKEIRDLDGARLFAAIERGLKREDIKKVSDLNLDKDIELFEQLTIEDIARREEITPAEVRERYMSEEMASITDGKKLKASMPGTVYRSAEERGKSATFKKAKPYHIALIEEMIPRGSKFSEMPQKYQKMVMSTMGMGDSRGKTNGKSFTFKQYNVAEGNYTGLLEAVYGIKEANLKGKGEPIESFAENINISSPGGGKKKITEAEIKSSSVEEFQKLAGKAILGRGQTSVDKVLNANKESLKRIYNSAKNVVKNAKDPIKALDHIIDLMLAQTNRSIGGIKGLAGIESATMEGMRGSNPELAKELHNEHLTELLTMTKNFGKMMERFINKEQSSRSVDLQLDRMVEDYNQGVISEQRRELKDFTGASKMDYFNNKLFLGKDAFKQIPLSESTFAEAKNMAEVIRNEATKSILDKIKNTPYSKLTLTGVIAKQKIENAKEIKKVESSNRKVAEQASMASKDMSTSRIVKELNKRDEALRLAHKANKVVKKARVFDFDDTVARTNSKVFATRGNDRKVLTAEEFAKQGEGLVNEGWKMDFSDFNRVVEGKKGPLFEVMKKMKEAAGDRDMFILTARAPESAPAIKRFLDAMGIKIPLENITGLGNSTGKAKADWLVGKAAEGYNDFYFADDAKQNVKAVRDALEVLDVKSKVQQVYAARDLSGEFNRILEEKTGIGREKVFSDIKAEIRGNKAKKVKFFIPPSAEDFLGLLYSTLPKGEKGTKALDFYQKNLFDPYTRATDNLSTDRVNLMADFKALKKELDVPKDLRKQTESGFTNEQAVRVYLWNKTGIEIPGLSKSDFKELYDIVQKNPKLQAFAEQILSITKGDGYSVPGQHWQAGTITTDLIDVLNTTKRAKYLEPWKENIDIIFSKENMNKLEAAFGPKYREAMENILTRMKSGSNRVAGGNRLSNQVLDYVNQSTGVTMFFNTRSALLQTISSANFINWSFNNPLRAGQAFANQPQYWKDFVELMNSDYLKDRRNGLKLNISESEIADAAKTSKNKAKAAISYIIEKGYMPTRFADSFAIASGGAMFYRNRIKDLVKKGMTEAKAKEIAMKEFRQASEKSQQSSDPSKISQQQAGDLGRIILQYVNTPMQYARIQKRDIQDIINRRPMQGKTLAQSNRIRLSRIAYYSFLQNLMFNALQQGAFALGFGDDDKELTEKQMESKAKFKQDKLFNTVNGMLDSQLRGFGLGGVTVQVLKNLGIDIYKRSKKDRPEYVDSWITLLEFSPSIKSKLSRFKSAAYPFDTKKRRQEVFDKGFSLDNPAYESMAKVITATTNVPLDRMYSKIDNLKHAMADETEAWQSVANVLGWPSWQLEQREYTNNVELTPMQKEVQKQTKEYEKYKEAEGSTDYEVIKRLNSSQQIKMLKDLGYDSYTIKKAKSEKDKINLIIKVNSGEEIKINKEEKEAAKYKALSKAEQVRKLDSLGLSKAAIRKLKYEADRVKKLLKLMNK
tara:strand:- start:857 stop:10135 length:9279 start_codon:yes stop_codon:yes gene_type:complete